ncbi:MAG: hypothetical protein AB7L66_00830 [Gemmatimonadales bacterium]
MRPIAIAALLILAFAACKPANGNRDDDPNPFEPAQPDTVTPADPDTAVGSLRGFGFYIDSGSTSVSATVNARQGGACQADRIGGIVYRLPITAGIMARLQGNRTSGGRAYVRPVTQHTFTGRGLLSYAHQARIFAGQTTFGSTQDADQATDPVQSVAVDVTPEITINTASLQIGDTLRVEFTAQVGADLAAVCGQNVVGFAGWRAFGVILWLAS